MEQLNKALAFSKEQGLTNGFFVRMPMGPVDASTTTSEVQVPVIVTTPMMTSTTISGTTLGVE